QEHSVANDHSRNPILRIRRGRVLIDAVSSEVQHTIRPVEQSPEDLCAAGSVEVSHPELPTDIERARHRACFLLSALQLNERAHRIADDEGFLCSAGLDILAKLE